MANMVRIRSIQSEVGLGHRYEQGNASTGQWNKQGCQRETTVGSYQVATKGLTGSNTTCKNQNQKHDWLIRSDSQIAMVCCLNVER